MNQMMVANAVRLAGASVIQRSPISAPIAALPAVEAAPTIRLEVATPSVNREALAAKEFVQNESPPVGLPLLNSRTGNLFMASECLDLPLHWFLPEFSLRDDIDTGFAFAASQSDQQDQDGHPLYTAQVRLTLNKSQPRDVSDFSKANPMLPLREIPLAELSATLTSLYTDDAGLVKQRDVGGTVNDLGDGSFLLSFAPILGQSVLGIYQDLTVFGKAQVNVTASYQALSRDPVTFARPVLQLPVAAVVQPIGASPSMRMRSFAPIASRTVGLGEPPPRVASVQTRQLWEAHLPLVLKYRQDAYQLKYTVSTDQIANQVIRDANDLRDFTRGGSEYRELKALGDINQKYPSLSRAYVGAFSRTIVVIPSRYSIVRSRTGCAASCMALVDSAAPNGSKCKFEFDFAIAPEVSRIEFLQFAQDVSRNLDLKNYKLKFPDFLQDSPPPTLQTAFKSTAQFSAGSDMNTFAVSVSMEDEGAQTPSVANANLFIMQLCSDSGVGLIGSLNLKLDDSYTTPVLAAVVLNFRHTSGSDELGLHIDAASPQITLTNQSPLDMQVLRYAFVSPSAITVTATPFQLLAEQALSIPLPAEHADLMLAADAQLMLPTPMTKAVVAKFLSFQTAEVQETQYVVAVDGGGVNFEKVDSIVASITFATLPTVLPRVLTLSKNVHSDSTHIVIPLENAVFSLPGEVNLTVRFSDRILADLQFTIQNDFTVNPVLILVQGDIDRKMS